MEYKTLDCIEIEKLHTAFLDAFSDYQVKIDLPVDKFKMMLKRNGFVPGLSLGAFEKGRLIAFIINGVRNWEGQLTAYDSGTGVVPEYRKQGITSGMFRNLHSLLVDKKVRKYLLEVIKSNTPAVNLYKKLGFSVTREFICFKAEKAGIESCVKCDAEYVDDMNSLDWNILASFWDFNPSWQNSIDSVVSAPDDCVTAVVRVNNEIAGYGIINKAAGSIYQMAVRNGYRHKGVGASIMAALLNKTESTKITFINVDSRSASTCDFLRRYGFTNYVEQYEMIKKL